jgi:predicted RNA-binding Zn ribbon-like protein
MKDKTMNEELSIQEGLELIRKFVNTYEVENDRDRIATPKQLKEWAAENGHVIPAKAKLGEEDVKEAQNFRESLRHLLLHNSGEELDAATPDTITELSVGARLRAKFDEHGHCVLTSDADGVGALFGSILPIVLRAQDTGEWDRLKACSAEDCQWAFYDSSRNKTKMWCSMEVCGNRHKAKKYRERAKEYRELAAEIRELAMEHKDKANEIKEWARQLKDQARELRDEEREIRRGKEREARDKEREARDLEREREREAKDREREAKEKEREARMRDREAENKSD